LLAAGLICALAHMNADIPVGRGDSRFTTEPVDSLSLRACAGGVPDLFGSPTGAFGGESGHGGGPGSAWAWPEPGAQPRAI